MRMNPAWTPTQQSLYAKLVNWCDYPPTEAAQIVNASNDNSVDKSLATQKNGGHRISDER